MHHPLDVYIPIAQSIVALLQPYAEAVIHDFRTGKIHAIFNPYSRRQKGEDSLLGKEVKSAKLPDYFDPYLKTNWDGRKLKSVTSTLRDAKGNPIGFLCFNLDVSKWEEWHSLFEEFASNPSEMPKKLLVEDWKDKASRYIFNRLKTKQLSLDDLTKQQKKELILELRNEGIFQEKSAASFVGEILGVSRNTIHKYLSDIT